MTPLRPRRMGWSDHNVQFFTKGRMRVCRRWVVNTDEMVEILLVDGRKPVAMSTIAVDGEE